MYYMVLYCIYAVFFMQVILSKRYSFILRCYSNRPKTYQYSLHFRYRVL